MFLCRKSKSFNNFISHISISSHFSRHATTKSSSSSAALIDSEDSLPETSTSVHTYLLVAQTLVNLRRNPGIALAVYRGVQTHGIRHDLFTYSIIVRILSNSSDQRKKSLISLFSEIILAEGHFCFDLPAHLEIVSDSLLLVFDSIIKAYVFCGKGEDAVEAFLDLTAAGSKPSLRTCNFLINFLAKGSSMEMVTAAYHCMKRSAICPDVHTFTILIKASCRSGDFEKAGSFLEEMMRPGVTPDLMAYTTFIGGLCACRRPDLAIEFLNVVVESQGVSSLAYNMVMSAFCKQMKLEEAEKVFEDMFVLGVPCYNIGLTLSWSVGGNRT